MLSSQGKLESCSLSHPYPKRSPLLDSLSFSPAWESGRQSTDSSSPFKLPCVQLLVAEGRADGAAVQPLHLQTGPWEDWSSRAMHTHLFSWLGSPQSGARPEGKHTDIHFCKRISHKGELPGWHLEDFSLSRGGFPLGETEWMLVCCSFYWEMAINLFPEPGYKLLLNKPSLFTWKYFDALFWHTY